MQGYLTMSPGSPSASHLAVSRTKPEAEGGRAEKEKAPGSLAKSLSCCTRPDCPGAATTDKHKHTLYWFKPLTAECPDTSGGRGRGDPAATKTKDHPEDGEQRGL